MRRIRIFAALLATIWLADGSRIATAFTAVPEGTPINTQRGTEPHPPAVGNDHDWLWLRAIGGGALAVAFLTRPAHLIALIRVPTLAGRALHPIGEGRASQMAGVDVKDAQGLMRRG